MQTHDQPVSIISGDAPLAGTVITPGGLVPGVLFVHGWGGSQTQYLARAREIAKLGCICLAFDLGGHAATSGLRDVVSRESNLQDLLAAYDLLASHSGVDPASIAVVGSSYGGYLAAILTAVRPVRWLGLRVPALYKDDSWDTPKQQLRAGQDLDAWRQSFVPAAENRALRACAEFKGDALVIESENDIIIPHAVITSYVESFAQASSLTYRVIKGADHGLSQPADRASYGFLLTHWLGEMVRGARQDEGATSEPLEAVSTRQEPLEAPPGDVVPRQPGDA